MVVHDSIVVKRCHCADSRFSRHRYPENSIRRLWITANFSFGGPLLSFRRSLWRRRDLALSVTELSQLPRFIAMAVPRCFVLIPLAV
jgi:hypothetical protein